MSKSLSEFKKFLSKKQGSFTEYEKKLSRLILDNFDRVAATSYAGGQRGKLIAKLINNAGDSASSDLNIAIDTVSNNSGKVTRLSSIKVQNFRGFSNEQTLEFKNPYTFIYGPNGTGKSSLCEALEYSLLGSINEAEAKRIDIAAYIKNAITRKSNNPILTGLTVEGNDVVVHADPNSYEFCFIEKNRIDGFARVAANTAQAQQTRLAALFGLEEFNSFATQFNDNFNNYLDCTGKKSKELVDKEKSIAGHKAILLQLPEKEKAVKSRQESILLKFHTCKTLDDIKTLISGIDGNGGLSKKNNTEIGRLSNLKLAIDPGIDAILMESKNLFELIQERRSARQFLSSYKDQLSLGDLYSAILKNQDKYENKCPACESTIYQGDELIVPIDPYQNATEKLKQFDEAIKKEARIKAISELLNNGWSPLSIKIANCLPVATSINFTRTTELESLKVACISVSDANSLEIALNLISVQSELLTILKAAIVAFNQQVEKLKAEIIKLESENVVLSKYLEEIISINTTIKANFTSATAANSAIEKFETENEALIKQVEQEKPIVARNIKYLSAYQSFREKLLQYNSNLPLSLAADLNEKALKFYNAINRYDHVSDQLKSFTLPTSVGMKIQIEFEIGQKYDALQILSEGHIRCMGLAILLSKIVRDDLPFLIFDDVVNSIDDEHRSGIIELILGNDDIKSRQLIITTHGEDFVKRLENYIPRKSYGKAVSRIDFLVPVEAKRIFVKLDLPRHYLTIAEQSLQDGRVRDCLSYVRKSFEELLNRLWKKIANKSYTAQIQVAMRAPNTSPDLMSIAVGLNKFLLKEEVLIFQNVRPFLEKMIGKENTHSVEWGYLNKGTHEGDQNQEFDSVVVKEMLGLVMEIDDAIDTSGTAVADHQQA